MQRSYVREQLSRCASITVNCTGASRCAVANKKKEKDGGGLV